ncbi:biotin carboxylase (plasmid) [Ensifer sp. WSM1721]|uniref:ATP-grasp domain-containing protein n=1 Tax=Ensifer sp. WSM1721 TaxID=1041159 RepID=UPI0035242098
MVEAEPTGTGLLFVQAAQRLGLHPIKLSASPTRDNYSETIETIHIDTNNLDVLIRECSRLRKTYDIAGITSPNEVVYATVGKLCEHFDLPGPSPASVERCCDKFAQRQLLAEAGIPVPAYRLAANTSEVERAAADIGLPVIVKPAVGRGSSGVRLCSNFDELAEHATSLLGWQSLPRILVEEFARGPYYSVEIMGNEVIGIGTGDFGPPPHFVYREFTYPAVLTDDKHERIADVSLGCLRALGLGWGPKNIELRWTELGPLVIEVNPRLAGSPTPELVQLAYGVDLATEHIKLVIGGEQNLRRRYSQAAAVRFLVPDRDGTLNWIDGDSRAAAVSGVAEVKFYIEPKTSIVRKGDYRDSIGHVIAASPNNAQTMAALNHAVEAIHWSITPFPTTCKPEDSVANSDGG